MTREDRFLAKVEKTPSGCWLWTATVTAPSRGRKAGGYGLFWSGEKLVLAHRWAFNHWRGPCPPNLDHVVCDTPRCVNPWHVEPSTSRANILRSSGLSAQNARKTHCAAGHPFDEANTHVDKAGRRHCRACMRERQRLVRQRGGWNEYMRDYNRSRREKRAE